jgi:hypothetical protein
LVKGIKHRLYKTQMEDTLWIADALWRIFPGEMTKLDYKKMWVWDDSSKDDPGVPPKLAHTDATVLRKLVRDTEFLRYIDHMPPERGHLIAAYHVWEKCVHFKYPERFSQLIERKIITPDTDRDPIRDLARNDGKTIEELRQEARDRMVAQAQSGTVPHQVIPGSQLILGSYKLLTGLVQDESADVVFLDPEWNRESLYLFGEGAELASRKLKAGGLVLAIAPNDFPVDAANLLHEHDFHFRHYYFIRYTKRLPKRHNAQIHEGGQLWFLYQKKPKTKLWHRPVRSIDGAPDTRHHQMGCGEKQMEYYLSELVRPGSLLLDFFAGSATAGVVCWRLGIRYIGTEIDPEHYDIARGRLSKTVNEL